MSPSPDLIELPFEILDVIVSYLDSASTLLYLSLTCRRFSHYAIQDGFRTWVQTHFPFAGISRQWSDTAKFLVALARAWEQKAFVARELKPDRQDPGSLRVSNVQNGVRSVRIVSNSPQSMGYQPVVQCVDNGNGNSSRESSHIVAWGAGAELILRNVTSSMGENEQDAGPQWTVWKDASTVDGRDDITSLNLLKSDRIGYDDKCCLVVGRASSKLEQVILSQEQISTHAYETQGRSVRSTDITSSSDLLLAASLDERIAIYPASPCSDSRQLLIQAESPVLEGGAAAQSWTIKFLSSSRLGVGRGPAFTPLCIFDIEPTGIRSNPGLNHVSARQDSVYAIEPLPAPRGSENLFLAGWFSGMSTLHDLRCPENIALRYEDPIDPGAATYSICSFANDRFIAGGSRHSCIKVFDLRIPGRKTYAVKDLKEREAQRQMSDAVRQTSFETGYNLFLGYRKSERYSPVYSLAKASAYSSTFYAGLENRVLQIDLHSLDSDSSRPQPSLPYANRLGEYRHEPNIEGIVRLALVEHTHSGIHSMYRQVPQLGGQTPLPGWDPRWVKASRRSGSPIDWHSNHRSQPRQRMWR